MAVTMLALRAAGLGDLLTAVPALRALAEHAPANTGAGGGVHVATPRWLHAIVDLIPGLAGAVGVRGLRSPRVAPWTVAVNLHGSGPQSHRALLASGAAELIAYRSPGVWDSGPDWVAEESERERWCRLLTWAGIPADPGRVGISRPAMRPWISAAAVLHIGASDGARRWPAAHFAEVARSIRDRPVVLTGTRPDRPTAEWIAREAGIDPTHVLTGALSLPRLAALVAAADVVVSGDTGVAHLAVAYGTPSVVVFGPASPVRWGPPASGVHRLLRAPGRAPLARAVPPTAVSVEVADLMSTGSRPRGRPLAGVAR